MKSYLFQFFLGLVHMHTHLFIHGDLKLSNAMVDPEKGLLKLTDLGLARLTHRTLNWQMPADVHAKEYR